MIERIANRRAVVPSIDFWIGLLIWLNVLVTFNQPGRQDVGLRGIDSVALLKVLVRMLSVTVFGWIVFARLRTRLMRQIVSIHSVWVLFVGWAILSTAWSPLKSFTLGQAGGQLTLVLLSACVAIRFEHINRYWLNCLLALFLYCSVFGLGTLMMPDTMAVERSSSDSIVHPTALGAAGSLGVILCVGLCLASKSRSLQYASIATVPACLIALIVAHNRLALILTLLIGVTLFVVKGKSHLLAIICVAFSGLGAIYILLDPGLVLVEAALGSSVDFFNRGQSKLQLTQLSGRAEMWSKMWESYLDSPLIGHGYLVSAKTGKILVWHQETNHTAHNIALQALVSTGIIGLVLFAIWILKIAQMVWSIWIRSTNHVQQDLKSSFPEFSILPFAIMVWFLGWTFLNESILGPIRPESVVFAIATGAIAGRHHFLRSAALGDRFSQEHQTASHQDGYSNGVALL